MAFFSLTNAAPEAPPGFRNWDAAERARLSELLAETEAAVAHRKPRKATASAKGDNHGWDQIIAKVADPARFRSAKDVQS